MVALALLIVAVVGAGAVLGAWLHRQRREQGLISAADSASALAAMHVELASQRTLIGAASVSVRHLAALLAVEVSIHWATGAKVDVVARSSGSAQGEDLISLRRALLSGRSVWPAAKPAEGYAYLPLTSATSVVGVLVLGPARANRWAGWQETLQVTATQIANALDRSAAAEHEQFRQAHEHLSESA